MCDKTCIFCFFPIINKYIWMEKRSLLSSCPSYKSTDRIVHMLKNTTHRSTDRLGKFKVSKNFVFINVNLTVERSKPFAITI